MVRTDFVVSRNTGWDAVRDFAYDGDPLPPIASVALEVRLYPGQPGAAKIVPAVTFEDLADPTDDRPTRRVLRLTVTAPATALSVAATGTGLNQPEPGEADAFAHDIVIIYADGTRDKLAWGAVFLEPGVTAYA